MRRPLWPSGHSRSACRHEGLVRASTVAPGLAVLLVSATVQDVVLLAMASLVLPLAACWLAGHVPKMVEPKVGFEPTTVGYETGRRGPEGSEAYRFVLRSAISGASGYQCIRRCPAPWWSRLVVNRPASCR